VETPDGQTYAVYLCGRPLRNRGTCTLGRETAIQPMVWGEDGWLRTLDGAGTPELQATAPGLPEHRFEAAPVREDFDAPQLPIDFQWLRTPWPEELFSLTARPGHLRLFGRETMGSQFRQALVARRQQAHCYSASTVVEFEPEHYQQAGLVCYYGGAKFHYLYITHDDDIGKHLRVMSSLPNHVQADAFTAPIALPRACRCSAGGSGRRAALLRLSRGGRRVAMAAAAVRRQYPVGRSECAGQPNFTGAFVGMACQDMAGAHCTPTLIISSTASGRTPSIRASGVLVALFVHFLARGWLLCGHSDNLARLWFLLGHFEGARMLE
jgi:xylan 1,4-beta-xylosidase